MPKEYHLFDYFADGRLPRAAQWAQSARERLGISPPESEWALCQLNAECCNGYLTHDQMSAILASCDEFLEGRNDPSQSCAENMYRFQATGEYERPEIRFAGQLGSTAGVFSLLTLGRFVRMLKRSKRALESSDDSPFVRDELVSRLSDPTTAKALSGKMETDGVELGRESEPGRLFWFTDLAQRIDELSFPLSRGDLSDLLESLGLPWCDSAPVDVVGIRIPSNSSSLVNPMIPTAFHGANPYFQPNLDGQAGWGRTLDKRNRSPHSGMPELIHETVPWHRDFFPFFAGTLKNPLLRLRENDWDQVRVNYLSSRTNATMCADRCHLI